MNITLTKHIFGDFTIPAGRLAGVFGPNFPTDKAELSDPEIRQRFQEPVGTPFIREMARGANRVLVVTDDHTRPTPLARLLPPLLEELKTAGIPESKITFLVGLGTHRPMRSEEIKDKFGQEVSSRYRIVNHAWDDPSSLISLESCDLGFEIVINRLATEADLILAVGSIVPHATTGFSGGGKTIMPGICGGKTIEDTHWKALDFAMTDILGNLDNPMRQAIVGVCRKVNLFAIINTVLFNDNRVYDLVVGDVETAHRLGVDACLDVYGVPVGEKADIVVAEAYPTDIDLRQAIKAICSADVVCRDNGVIILPAECPEGIAPQFPEFAQYGFSNPERLYQQVQNGVFKQKLMAYTLVAIGRIISKRVQAILVSSGIGESVANKMGFQWASDLQSALDKAYEKVGSKGRVMVLKEAGQILPLLKSKV